MADNSNVDAQEMDNVSEPAEGTPEVADGGNATQDWQQKFKDPEAMYSSYKSLEEKLGDQGREMGEMRQMMQEFVSQPQQPSVHQAPQYLTPEEQRAIDFIDNKLGVKDGFGKLSEVERKQLFLEDKLNFQEFTVRHPELNEQQRKTLWELGGKMNGLADYEKIYNSFIKPLSANTETPKQAEEQKKAKGTPVKAGEKSSGEKVDVKNLSTQEFLEMARSGELKKLAADMS